MPSVAFLLLSSGSARRRVDGARQLAVLGDDAVAAVAHKVGLRLAEAYHGPVDRLFTGKALLARVCVVHQCASAARGDRVRVRAAEARLVVGLERPAVAQVDEVRARTDAVVKNAGEARANVSGFFAAWHRRIVLEDDRVCGGRSDSALGGHRIRCASTGLDDARAPTQSDAAVGRRLVGAVVSAKRAFKARAPRDRRPGVSVRRRAPKEPKPKFATLPIKATRGAAERAVGTARARVLEVVVVVDPGQNGRVAHAKGHAEKIQ